jgi:FixJ family two-component response regulator
MRPSSPKREKNTVALIAVVDDNEGVLATIRLLLRSRHADEVALYSDPQELLHALEQGRRPDLVITDFCMPTMNGEDLLNAISRLDNSIPGIVITGYPEGLDALAKRYPILCKGTRDFIPLLLRQVDSLLPASSARPGRLVARS